MRLELLPFQEDAAKDVLQQLSDGAKDFDSTRDRARPIRTAFALSSVTGSGKTVMAAAVCETLLFGSTDFGIDPIEDLVIVWAAYDPGLCSQAKRSLSRVADKLPAGTLKIIDSESFNEHELSPGHIYFLSLSLLGGSNRLTRTSETRTHTFYETLTKTVNNSRLLVIIDEAHVGMGSGSGDSTSLVQRLIAGHDGWKGAPLVWGLTATPQRFDDRIKTMLPGSAGENVKVSPSDVQASGLLKRGVSLFAPRESASMALTMLGSGMAELVASQKAWADYCTSNGVPSEQMVHPLLVVQLANREDGSKTRDEDKMVVEVVRAAKQRLRGFSSANIAHVIPDRGTIKVGDIEVRRVDPDLVSDDTDISVLIAKDAISTGWDCPRAEVLVSMRHFNDPTAITQMLGRMVRTPLARTTGEDRLDRVCCWVPFFNTETAVKVVEVLTGDREPDGRDKPRIEVDLNPVQMMLGGGLVDDEDEAPILYDVPDSELTLDGDEDDDDTDELDDVVPMVDRGDDDMVRPEDVPVPAAPEPAREVDPEGVRRLRNRQVSPEVIEAISALPSQSKPESKMSPVRRALKVANFLATNESTPGNPLRRDAGKQVKDELARVLAAQAHIMSDEVAAAREQVVTADQTEVYSTDGQVRTRDISIRGDIDVIRSEFNSTNNKTCGIAKHYFTQLSTRANEETGDFNEFELKADVAALGYVPEVLQELETRAVAIGKRYMDEAHDAVARAAESVRDEYEQLRKTDPDPVSREVQLSKTRSYPMNSKQGQALTLLPKHIYCDADGMWPVPTRTAQNSWEMQVLTREVNSDPVVAWYRNPDTNRPDALSIAYLTSEGKWRTAQPDFIFVEQTADGYKAAIVDPHWSNDADGLARMKAFADWVEANRHLITRFNPVTKVGDRLMRLSLQDASVREAVRRASSVNELFATHGTEYPTS